MDALVVGAGPSGLLMAAELARHGLHPRVVDRDEHGATESRALAIQARTVELLDDLGLAETFLARGLRARGMQMWSEADGALADVDFDAIGGPFPFVLDLAQAETEALLAEHLEGLGVRVERRTELVGFEQEPGAVRATLRGPDGDEAVEAPWIIGCDGAHSTVRHVLGISFSGTAVALDWGLADVVVTWPLQADRMQMFLRGDGLMASFPMREGRWRLICEVGPADADKPAPAPDLGFFADYVERCHPGATVTDPRWLAGFRVSERQAAHIRDRRAFLVGDAAHIHSPAGGQGMNTGLQDAYNLAWKLALVQRGQAPPGLLDTFERERHPVAERVVKQTSALFRMALVRGAAAQRARDVALRHLAGLAPVQRRMVQAVSERDINYRDSPIVAEHRRPSGAPHPGDLAPDAGPEVRGALRGTEHVALVLDGTPPPDLGPYADRVRVVGAPQAREAYGGAALCVVRPDGYLAYVAGDADGDALRGYLGTVLLA